MNHFETALGKSSTRDEASIDYISVPVNINIGISTIEQGNYDLKPSGKFMVSSLIPSKIIKKSHPSHKDLTITMTRSSKEAPTVVHDIEIP